MRRCFGGKMWCLVWLVYWGNRQRSPAHFQLPYKVQDCYLQFTAMGIILAHDFQNAWRLLHMQLLPVLSTLFNYFNVIAAFLILCLCVRVVSDCLCLGSGHFGHFDAPLLNSNAFIWHTLDHTCCVPRFDTSFIIKYLELDAYDAAFNRMQNGRNQN